jgi:hypothetical protein
MHWLHWLQLAAFLGVVYLIASWVVYWGVVNPFTHNRRDMDIKPGHLGFKAAPLWTRLFEPGIVVSLLVIFVLAFFRRNR